MLFKCVKSPLWRVLMWRKSHDCLNVLSLHYEGFLWAENLDPQSHEWRLRCHSYHMPFTSLFSWNLLSLWKWNFLLTKIYNFGWSRARINQPERAMWCTMSATIAPPAPGYSRVGGSSSTCERYFLTCSTSVWLFFHSNFDTNPNWLELGPTREILEILELQHVEKQSREGTCHLSKLPHWL